jgi:hypothetical protein
MQPFSCEHREKHISKRNYEITVVGYTYGGDLFCRIRTLKQCWGSMVRIWIRIPVSYNLPIGTILFCQACFQPAQHIYWEREGSGAGSGSIL